MVEELNWHSLSIEETFGKLQTDANGLTDSEVEKRLVDYGRNEIVEEKKGKKLILFFNQFKNPLIGVLIAAAIISLIVDHAIDAVVIAVVIVINTKYRFLSRVQGRNGITSFEVFGQP